MTRIAAWNRTIPSPTHEPRNKGAVQNRGGGQGVGVAAHMQGEEIAVCWGAFPSALNPRDMPHSDAAVRG